MLSVFFRLQGAILEPGDLIASMILDDPSAVRLSTPFRGLLPEYGEPWPTSASKQERPHIVLRDAMGTVRDVLAGWQVPDIMVQQALRSIDTLVYDKRLCLLEFNEIMSNIEARLPSELRTALNNLRPPGGSSGSDGETKEGSSSSSVAADFVFPVDELKTTIVDHCSLLPTRQAETLMNDLLNPLIDLSESYRGGPEQHMTSLVISLVSEYLEIEQPFSSRGTPDSEIILRLRRQHTPNFKKVFEYALSHGQVKRKNILIVCMLNRCMSMMKSKKTEPHKSSLATGATVATAGTGATGATDATPSSSSSNVRAKLSKLLKALAALSESGGRKYAPVTLKARQMLIQHHIPSWLERRTQFSHILERAPFEMGCKFNGSSLLERTSQLLPLIEQSNPVLPMALHVLQSNDAANGLRAAAMEVYIRRVYRSYDLISIECMTNTNNKNKSNNSLIKFEFKSPDDQQVLVKSGSSNNLSSLISSGSSGAGGSHGRQNSIASNGLDERLQDVRTGVFGTFATYEELELHFNTLIQMCSTTGASSKKEKENRRDDQNVLHIAILDTAMGGKFNTDKELKPAEQRLAKRLANVIATSVEQMAQCGIRRVTFVVMHAPRGLEGGRNAKSQTYAFDYQRSTSMDDSSGSSTGEDEEENPYDDDPGIFTFRRSLEYSEDRLIRDQEPTLAFRLELERMSNFNVNQVFSRNRNIHVYQALDKFIPKPSDRGFSSRTPKPSHRFLYVLWFVTIQ